jgi:hypothetical protein
MKCFRLFPLLAVALLAATSLSAERAQDGTQPQKQDSTAKQAGSVEGTKGSSFNANSKLIRMAHGTMKDGFPFSENLYLGPDGEEVYFKTIHYHSADRVKKEFEAGLKESAKVLDHRKAADKNSQIKSEMVVITRAEGDEKILAMILITSGENLRTVRSYSLEDVLAVAKDLKPLE